MLHFKEDESTWPDPSYTLIKNINLIMQSKIDITKEYAKKIEAKKKMEAVKAKIAEEEEKAAHELMIKSLPPIEEILNLALMVPVPKAPIAIKRSMIPTTTVTPIIHKAVAPENSNHHSHRKIKIIRTIRRQRKITQPKSKSRSNVGVHIQNSVITKPKEKIEDTKVMINSVQLNALKKRAYQANVHKKIFSIYGGFDYVRRALLNRGWVEKMNPHYFTNLQAMLKADLLKHASEGNDYERVLLSKLVEPYPTYFLWQPTNMTNKYAAIKPYINRIRRSVQLDFSTKIGLIGCAEQSHWHTIEGVAEVVYPRFYRLESPIEKMEFLFDYRVTQAIALLNYVTSVLDYNELFNDHSAKIDLKVLYFAIESIEKTLNKSEEMSFHQTDPFDVEEKERWQEFFLNSSQIINKKDVFRAVSVDFARAYKACKKVLLEARTVWKTLHMDGYKNMWIVKPGFQNRGIGIYIFTDYDSIIKFVARNPRTRYIVQKYIERPLLVYNTKFDIRQYLLITITDTLNIWLYKDCYLKFSSQEYTLQDFRESVHITNHTVQRKYLNGVKRSAKLPRHNMWNLGQFKQYLKEIGKADAWDTISYPGIKRIVTGIVLTSLEETEINKNSFELYGCDFMLDENFQTVLIEVNSSPDMYASTIVTAKICPAVLNDLIKVVIDRPQNPHALTGNFELIYQIDLAINPTNLDSIATKGIKIKTEEGEEEVIPSDVATKELCKQIIPKIPEKINKTIVKATPKIINTSKDKKTPNTTSNIQQDNSKFSNSQSVQQKNHTKNHIRKRKHVNRPSIHFATKYVL